MWCEWNVNSSVNCVFPQKVEKIKKFHWFSYLTLSQKQKIENIFSYGNVIIVYSVELILFLYEGDSPMPMRKKNPSRNGVENQQITESRWSSHLT